MAAFAFFGIAAHFLLFFGGVADERWQNLPLLLVLLAGGLPLTIELFFKLVYRQFGSDLLAGISIVTSVLLHEYLAGAFVVLMLSGGEALEDYAVRSASRALEILSKRMPSTVHRRSNGQIEDMPLEAVQIDEELVVMPHETCPVDGVVVEGHSAMDESYLTGEPYVLSKTPGSTVLSGAVNGDGALIIRASSVPTDSRYAKIIEVMRMSERQRPQLRRLGDQLGALYTPCAVVIALIAWLATGNPIRFLAVLVVATPCPLLIGIPVAIIGAVSLAAKRGIIIKNPAALEQIALCETAIFDKTGTLTYGEPQLVEIAVEKGFDVATTLALAASLERYSKHPLASAILSAARERELVLHEAASISEEPGRGLQGLVAGRDVAITGRKALTEAFGLQVPNMQPAEGGLECMVIVDRQFAAVLRFRDEPRCEGPSLIAHLGPKHNVRRLLMVSGDRESEVRHLADRVGIHEIFASQTPEQKVEIVRNETARSRTVFLGDGINDAPALVTATVGVAFGQNSDVTAEAADAVIMDNRLEKFDEFLHIGRQMRKVSLESAVGGMALSIGGMLLAAFGLLPPVAGAVLQEAIDVIAILNALRTSLPMKHLTDF